MIKSAIAFGVLVFLAAAPLGNRADSNLPQWLLLELHGQSGQWRSDAIDAVVPEVQAAIARNAFEVDRYLCANGFPYPCSQLVFDAGLAGPSSHRLMTDARSLTKKLCDEGDYPVCNDFADILLNEGQDEEALRVFERTCHLYPSGSCYSAASMNLKRGKTAKASDFAVRSCLGDSSRCGDFLSEEIDARAHAFLLARSEDSCLGPTNSRWGMACVKLGAYNIRTSKSNLGLMVLGLDCMKGNDVACEVAAIFLDRQNKRSEATNIYLKLICSNPSLIMTASHPGFDCKSIEKGRAPASIAWKSMHERHDRLLGF